MISYAISVLAIVGATLIPAYIALYLISNLKFVHIRYIAAAGVGLTFWFFYDTMGDAGSLDENYSVSPISAFGGLPHFALIAAFLAGIAALAIFDHYAVPLSNVSQSVKQHIGSHYSKSLFLIPVAVAAVMGIHGLGEGWDFGSGAALTSTSDLISAFGNLSSAISYPLHKFLEAGIIAAVYTCYVSRTNGAVKTSWWQIPVLGLLFGLPSIIGVSIGYFVAFNTVYFFAFGVTAALYAALRLVEPISLKFKIGENAPSYLGSKIFLAMAIGFFLLYSAALLH